MVLMSKNGRKSLLTRCLLGDGWTEDQGYESLKAKDQSFISRRARNHRNTEWVG